MNPLARPAALGAATGSRSSYGLAAVSRLSPSGGRGALGILTGPRGRRLSAAAAGCETVLDLLPITPNRLKPSGLVPRIVLGAGSATLVAQRDCLDVRAAAKAGAGASVVTAVLGVVWRRWGVRGAHRDLPHALIEDLLAAALATWGAQPSAAHRPVG